MSNIASRVIEFFYIGRFVDESIFNMYSNDLGL